MTQNVELSKVKAKILALSNKTVDNGCTEDEAMLAFAKINDLLIQYNLQMEDIDLREEACVTKAFETGQRNNPTYSGCALYVARLCDVRVWQGRIANNMKTYMFFGLESDVDMALYLMQLISRAIATETKKFTKSPLYQNIGFRGGRLSANKSFQSGMVVRINARLEEMKGAKEFATNEEAVRKTKLIGSNVRSLVVVKKEIVEEEFKKLGMRLRTTTSYKRVSNSGAYSEGKVAGGRVNLNRPIGSNASGPLMIGRR